MSGPSSVPSKGMLMDRRTCRSLEAERNLEEYSMLFVPARLLNISAKNQRMIKGARAISVQWKWAAGTWAMRPLKPPTSGRASASTAVVSATDTTRNICTKSLAATPNAPPSSEMHVTSNPIAMSTGVSGTSNTAAMNTPTAFNPTPENSSRKGSRTQVKNCCDAGPKRSRTASNGVITRIRRNRKHV